MLHVRLDNAVTWRLLFLGLERRLGSSRLFLQLLVLLISHSLTSHPSLPTNPARDRKDRTSMDSHESLANTARDLCVLLISSGRSDVLKVIPIVTSTLAKVCPAVIL